MNDMRYHNPTAKQRLGALQGIIWDLDNTLYRLELAVAEAFNLSVARAVLDAGVRMPLEEARALARQSFAQYGSSARIFIDRYKLNAVDLHYAYHGLIDEKIIEGSLEVRELFQRQALQHVLVTHSARDWALRVLTHLGLAQWFPSTHILAYEDYEFHAKHEHSTGFDRALAILGLEPARVAMVEDTLDNLSIPHKLGMATVYLRHGRRLEIPPGALDASCDSAVGFLQVVAEKNQCSASGDSFDSIETI